MSRVAQHKVVSGAATGDYIETSYFYDSRGRRCKVVQPSGAFRKTLYTAYGRVIGQYLCSSEGATNDPSTFTDDIVVEQTVPSYDDSLGGRVWLTARSQRKHTDTSTAGALDSSIARVTYGVVWISGTPYKTP